MIDAHRWPFRKGIFISLAIFFWSLAFSSACFAANPAQLSQKDEPVSNEDCLSCHALHQAGSVDPEKFQESVHGGNLCISCHAGIESLPHDIPLKPVNCSSCHLLETTIYLESDHGKALSAGVSESATCKICHGASHEILDVHNEASPVYRLNIPQTCAQCHGNVEDMKKFDLNQKEPVTSYLESVHGLASKKGVTAAAVCTDCHGSHRLSKATHPDSKLHWENIVETCGKCHENVALTYSLSIHGMAVKAGKREAPVCTDCHGEHTIDAVKQITSKVSPAHIVETCGQCHTAERIITKYQILDNPVQTYMESYHGLSLKLGSVTAANCASCHGVHNILPSRDPQSAIHPDNLIKTCGKCHAGVSEQVAQGKVHASSSPRMEEKTRRFVTNFYIMLIAAVIGFMLLHNILDFSIKVKAHYQKMAVSGRPVRMALNERWQHGILALSFILLAYTGFALQFPQSWWASPFVGRGDWRSQGHRWAALVFCVLAVYHIWFMFFTRRGRQQLKALSLRWTDVVQCGQMFAYYFGWRKEKPVFGFYSYIEKLEYWALVWGSFIMVITGALMIKENWFLRHFPKWFFDVIAAIHYYEAILACLAILIWHGYFVIFDPEEYPMKSTWLDGKSSHTDLHRKDHAS